MTEAIVILCSAPWALASLIVWLRTEPVEGDIEPGYFAATLRR